MDGFRGRLVAGEWALRTSAFRTHALEDLRKPAHLHPVSALAGALACGGLSLMLGMQQISAQKIALLIGEQREMRGHMSIEYLPDGLGGQVKTIRFTGVNVQVVNGWEPPTATRSTRP